MKIVELGRDHGIGKIVVSSAVTKEATDEQLREMSRRRLYRIHIRRLYTHNDHSKDPLLRGEGVREY